MIQLRSKGERLSYVDGYNNCYKLFCTYLREESTGDAVEKMTAVVNLINESVGRVFCANGERRDNGTDDS